jgi:hypothetical protein
MGGTTLGCRKDGDAPEPSWITMSTTLGVSATRDESGHAATASTALPTVRHVYRRQSASIAHPFHLARPLDLP